MKIRAPKDFWSGVMFCGFAAVAIFAARGYSLGSAGRMGPGYFPLLLAGLLAVLGGALIAAGVCLFGVLIEPSGLAVSLAVLTLMAALSGGRFRLVETLALAAALI